MNENELSALIARIKNRRIELGLSYQDVANVTNISKSTLQRYETGYIKKVPINQMSVLAKALHTTPGYLMGWEAAPSPALPLTPQEETHIKKYRQLDADGKKIIDEQIDFQLYKQLTDSPEKDELKLG